MSIDHLERRWSRFLPHSDISRLNNGDGSAVHVDPATIELLQAMVDGWHATDGAFDPTLLVPLVGLGYAASWNDPSVVTSLRHASGPPGDLTMLSMDRTRNLASARPGVCLDAGGIGKGLAADMVVDYMIAAGARGASVSIGGDLAVKGVAPQDGGWLIGVADAVNADIETEQLTVIKGGVATSGTLLRSWRDDDGESIHHLLDPATREPIRHEREIASATVVAGTAAWAEVWTKALMVRGVAALSTCEARGLAAKVTFADRSTVANRAWSTFGGSASAEERGDLRGDVVEMVEV
jgi:thiamine biosynthesis lipoprotein